LIELYLSEYRKAGPDNRYLFPGDGTKPKCISALRQQIERVVKDYHELLEDKSIEALLIATNTDTHAFIVKDAALAGKQIFCEKPLALQLEDIDEVMKTIETSGVKLQVGYNRRFDKSFQRVHQVVASGEIGRPCVLRITNRDPEPPSLEYARTSGGMFLDMSIHDFDMVRYQVGEGLQQDVARAQVELSVLGGRLTSLDQERQSAAARLNAILDRPPAAQLGAPAPLEKQPLSQTLDQFEAVARERSPNLTAARIEVGFALYASLITVTPLALANVSMRIFVTRASPRPADTSCGSIPNASPTAAAARAL
jgi:hypothetical protein